MLPARLVASRLALCALAHSPGLLAQIQRPSAVVITAPPRFTPSEVALPSPAPAGATGALAVLSAVDAQYFGGLEHIRGLARERPPATARITQAQAALNALRTRLLDDLERAWVALPAASPLSPELLLRLSELYADAAAQRALDHDGEALDVRCAIMALRGVVTEFPAFRQADFALERLGERLRSMGHDDEALVAYRALVCPPIGRYAARGGVDLSAPPDTAAPSLCPRFEAAVRASHPRWITPVAAAPASAITASAYARCAPSTAARAGEVWFAIGEAHFDAAHDDAGFALAAAAYRRAIALNPPAPFASLARYKLAWTLARMTRRQPEALRAFSELLDLLDATPPNPDAVPLRAEGVQWVATLLTDDTWGAADTQRCQREVERESRPPRTAHRPFQCAGIAWLQASRAPWRSEVWYELANGYATLGMRFEAITAYRLFAAGFPTLPRASEALEHAVRLSAEAPRGRP